jgi:hypothetical protein
MQFSKTYTSEDMILQNYNNKRMAQCMWTREGAFIQTQDPYKDSLCVKSHLIPRDFWVQACNSFLLG